MTNQIVPTSNAFHQWVDQLYRLVLTYSQLNLVHADIIISVLFNSSLSAGNSILDCSVPWGFCGCCCCFWCICWYVHVYTIHIKPPIYKKYECVHESLSITYLQMPSMNITLILSTVMRLLKTTKLFALLEFLPHIPRTSLLQEQVSLIRLGYGNH